VAFELKIVRGGKGHWRSAAGSIRLLLGGNLIDPAKEPTPGSCGREQGRHLLDPTYMTQEHSCLSRKFEL
jgi:hypothetical protein